MFPLLNLQDANPNRYTGPECAARTLAKHFSTNERSAARILDVAAGTGRLGAEVILHVRKVVDSFAARYWKTSSLVA